MQGQSFQQCKDPYQVSLEPPQGASGVLGYRDTRLWAGKILGSGELPAVGVSTNFLRGKLGPFLRGTAINQPLMLPSFPAWACDQGGWG